MFACQQLQQTLSTTQHLPLRRFRLHWSAPIDPQQQVFHCSLTCQSTQAHLMSRPLGFFSNSCMMNLNCWRQVCFTPTGRCSVIVSLYTHASQ